MSDVIRHDPAGQCFSIETDGETARLDYERDGSVMVITHTVVPPAIGGRGIAGQLVRAALDHARAEGWKVRPACSYADGWMSRHPQYASLRAS
ncbi:N-acetyltransferase [Lysobacter pythonis]|uniref:N-acetyltransferase n=1 Tax=Solilutibacter pythonis TaxID=2483112 RepID=A0A3M2I2G9_9GAMM|nr:GNAT family N-acetyltransferase [Lysobacter pythonis]RMH94535.1 N-acetyltransferase [Lysobacter pythonis]